MNGDSPREAKLITKHELIDCAIRTIKALSLEAKAKLRVQLRERFNLPQKFEPLIHGDFEKLDEFKPFIPKNSTGD
jgi:hypothetical protein